MDHTNNEIRKEEAKPNPDDHSKYKTIISILPKRKCWGTTYCKYQGFWLNFDGAAEIISSQENFKCQPSDIILSSFPKSGTTWLKSLAFSVFIRSDVDQSDNPLFTTCIHECVPFIEGKFIETRNPKIPLISTHIPYSCLPVSITDSGSKIVYVCREPKDVFVSLWCFLKNFTYVKDGSYNTFEEAVDLFCEGIVPRGPYWDHVLEYWKASIEFPERVLFLKYEDMKNDTVSVVKKLAEFMECSFSAEEEKEGMVQKIIDLCSFKNMSNLDVTKNGEFWPDTKFALRYSSFFRKGEVGDWKNHLTQEMADRFDQITRKKFSGSGLVFA